MLGVLKASYITVRIICCLLIAVLTFTILIYIRSIVSFEWLLSNFV